MRKIDVLAAVMFLAFFLGLCWSDIDFVGGGTADNPYQIWDANDLNALGVDPNYYSSHFKLMADVNLSAHTYTSAVISPDTDNTNESFDGIAFTGNFNGNGFGISDKKPGQELSGFNRGTNRKRLRALRMLCVAFAESFGLKE